MDQSIITDNGTDIKEYNGFTGIIKCYGTDCEVEDASLVVDNINHRIEEFADGTVLSGDMTVEKWSGKIFKGNSLVTESFKRGYFCGKMLLCGCFVDGRVSSGHAECHDWTDGIFSGDSFCGVWHRGYFRRGVFEGTWHDGVLLGGVFKGVWNGGQRKGGEWQSSSVEPPVLARQDISICKSCKYFRVIKNPHSKAAKVFGVGFYCSCHIHYAPWSKEYSRAVGKDKFEHATILFPGFWGECPQHPEYNSKF